MNQQWIIEKEMTFDSAHRLFRYRGRCASVHGHTYRVKVGVKGSSLDELNMVIDFGVVKEALKEITEELDHAILLNADDPMSVENSPETRCIRFKGNPTAEAMAQDIYHKMHARGLDVQFVKLWETPTSAVTYVEGGAFVLGFGDE